MHQAAAIRHQVLGRRAIKKRPSKREIIEQQLRDGGIERNLIESCKESKWFDGIWPHQVELNGMIKIG